LEYSDEFVDIVEKLLDKNQKTRLGTQGGVKEILSHPWFADLDIKKVESQSIPPPLKPDIKDG